MKYTYEIKFFNNSFTVIESRNELMFGGLRKIESKWKKQQFFSTEPYWGLSEIGIASWNRSKEWLTVNYPELVI